MSPFTVRIGGKWQVVSPGQAGGGPDGSGVFGHEIGKTSVQTFSDHWRTGCQQAAFTIDTGRRRGQSAHPALRLGSLVEIFDSAERVWLGAIATDPEGDDGGRITAEGLGMSLDDCAVTTTNLMQAATDAVGYGFRLIPYNLPTAVQFARSDATAQNNTLAGVLDAYAAEQARGWVVDKDGYLREVLPETTASLILTPDTEPMLTAGDDFVTHVFGRYISTVDANNNPTAWAVVQVSDPEALAWSGGIPRQRFEDLSTHGRLTTAQARSIVGAILADNAVRTSYGSPVTVQHGQVRTPGEIPVRLSLIAPGQRLTQFGSMTDGSFADKGQAPSWVIGHRVVNVAEGTATLSPTDLAPRTDEHVQAAVARLANKKTDLR